MRDGTSAPALSYWTVSNILAALTYHSGFARVFAGRSSWSPWVAAARSDCRRSGRVVTQELRPDIVEGEAVKRSAIALVSAARRMSRSQIVLKPSLV